MEEVKESLLVSTLTNISVIVDARNKLARLLWAVISLACLVVTVVLVTQSFERFFAYPISTSTYIETKPVEFPSVSICSLNPYRMSMIKKIPSLNNAIADYSRSILPPVVTSTSTPINPKPTEETTPRLNRKRRAASTQPIAPTLNSACASTSTTQSSTMKPSSTSFPSFNPSVISSSECTMKSTASTAESASTASETAGRSSSSPTDETSTHLVEIQTPSTGPVEHARSDVASTQNTQTKKRKSSSVKPSLNRQRTDRPFVDLAKSGVSSEAEDICDESTHTCPEPETQDISLQDIATPSSGIDGISWATQMEDALPYLMSNMDRHLLELAGYQLEEMIYWCSYAGVKCNFNSTRDFRRFIDGSYGNCFTFNPNYNDRITSRAGTKAGLSMIIQLPSSDFLPFMTSNGYKIQFHQPDDQPMIPTLGIQASAGSFYSFSIRSHSHTRHLLDEAFMGLCFGLTAWVNSAAIRSSHLDNMDSEGTFSNTRLVTHWPALQEEIISAGEPYQACATNATAHTVSYYKGKAYSAETCEASCYQKMVTDQCKCSDPRYPLPVGSLYCNITQKPCIDKAANDILTNSTSVTCACLPSCRSTLYRMSQTKAIWPSPNFRLSMCKGAVTGDEYKNCSDSAKLTYSRIDIYYASMTTLKLENRGQFVVLQLVSEIFANLGNWLGIGVISVFEIVILSIMLCAVKFRR